MRWRGQTVCILASGPSLTQADATYANAFARTIVINDTWRLLPTADALYAADRNWWVHRSPSPGEFTGERWTQDKAWERTPIPPRVQVIQSKPGDNIAPPGSDHVFTGSNSAYQAMGLAVLWGVTRIVFLGLDLKTEGKRAHWHPDYPAPLVNSTSTFPRFRKAFESAAPKLAALGVSVVNASRATALDCFPRCTIQEAFE